jgi:hypothetical protein
VVLVAVWRKLFVGIISGARRKMLHFFYTPKDDCINCVLMYSTLYPSSDSRILIKQGYND